MLVKDMGSMGYDSRFVAVLPTTCSELTCGRDLEITETLSRLYCPNPFCPSKIAQRMAALVKDLNIMHIGDARCVKFVNKFGIVNPWEIFAWDPVEHGEFNDGLLDAMNTKLYDEIQSHKCMTLVEFLKYSNLPGIRDNASKLLAGISSLEDLYDELDEEGYEFVQSQLGIDANKVAVSALQIYEVLLLHRDHLFDGISQVNILGGQGVMTWNVCLSTSVGMGYPNKKAFISMMNERYGNKVLLNQMESMSTACKYLICADKNSTTTKANNARKWGVPIITGAELEEILCQL